MAKSPSPAQAVILDEMSVGSKLERHFDVWGPKPDGTWFQLDGVVPVSRVTVAAMLNKGLISEGEETRPYSGHRVTQYSLTDAGLAALAARKTEGA